MSRCRWRRRASCGARRHRAGAAAALQLTGAAAGADAGVVAMQARRDDDAAREVEPPRSRPRAKSSPGYRRAVAQAELRRAPGSAGADRHANVGGGAMNRLVSLLAGAPSLRGAPTRAPAASPSHAARRRPVDAGDRPDAADPARHPGRAACTRGTARAERAARSQLRRHRHHRDRRSQRPTTSRRRRIGYRFTLESAHCRPASPSRRTPSSRWPAI